MVDLRTLLTLLPLFPALDRLVFVGDPDQLLPVEPVAVLPMVRGCFATATLTKNHRVDAASRALAAASRRIASGIGAGTPLAFAKLGTATKKDCLLHAECGDDKSMAVRSVQPNAAMKSSGYSAAMVTSGTPHASR